MPKPRTEAGKSRKEKYEERVRQFQQAAWHAEAGEPEPFGQLIARFRKRLGVSQAKLDEALEESLGEDKSSFTAQVESGRVKPPDKRTVRALAEILGITAQSLNIPAAVFPSLPVFPSDVPDPFRELGDGEEPGEALWILHAAPERLHAFDPDLFAWHREEIAQATPPDEDLMQVANLMQVAKHERELLAEVRRAGDWAKSLADNMGAVLDRAASEAGRRRLESRTVPPGAFQAMNRAMHILRRIEPDQGIHEHLWAVLHQAALAAWTMQQNYLGAPDGLIPPPAVGDDDVPF